MMWRADCFPVSRIDRKQAGLSLWGRRPILIGIKEKHEGKGAAGKWDNMEYSNVCSRSSKKTGWQVIRDLRYKNWFTIFQRFAIWWEMSPSWLELMNSVLSEFKRETNVSCCRLQAMLLRFGLSRSLVLVVNVPNNFNEKCWLSFLSLFLWFTFFFLYSFLSYDGTICD